MLQLTNFNQYQADTQREALLLAALAYSSNLCGSFLLEDVGTLHNELRLRLSNPPRQPVVLAQRGTDRWVLASPWLDAGANNQVIHEQLPGLVKFMLPEQMLDIRNLLHLLESLYTTRKAEFEALATIMRLANSVGKKVVAYTNMYTHCYVAVTVCDRDGNELVITIEHYMPLTGKVNSIVIQRHRCSRDFVSKFKGLKHLEMLKALADCSGCEEWFAPDISSKYHAFFNVMAKDTIELAQSRKPVKDPHAAKLAEDKLREAYVEYVKTLQA